MDLKTYLRSLSRDAKAPFATRCETTLNHLKNVAYGARAAGEKLCIAIERESGGQVRCEDLRSDVDWAYLRGSASTTEPPPSPNPSPRPDCGPGAKSAANPAATPSAGKTTAAPRAAVAGRTGVEAVARGVA